MKYTLLIEIHINLIKNLIIFFNLKFFKIIRMNDIMGQNTFFKL